MFEVKFVLNLTLVLWCIVASSSKGCGHGEEADSIALLFTKSNNYLLNLLLLINEILLYFLCLTMKLFGFYSKINMELFK